MSSTLFAVVDGKVVDRGGHTYKCLMKFRDVGYVAKFSIPKGLMSDVYRSLKVGDDWTEPRDPRIDPRVGDVLTLDGQRVEATAHGYWLGEEYKPWTAIETPHLDLSTWARIMADAEVVSKADGAPTPAMHVPKVQPRAARDVTPDVLRFVQQAGQPVTKQEIMAAVGGVPVHWVNKSTSRLVESGQVVRTLTSGKPATYHAPALKLLDGETIRFPNGETISVYDLLADACGNDFAVLHEDDGLTFEVYYSGLRAPAHFHDIERVCGKLRPRNLAEGRALAERWVHALAVTLFAPCLIDLDGAYALAAESYAEKISAMRGVK